MLIFFCCRCDLDALCFATIFNSTSGDCLGIYESGKSSQRGQVHQSDNNITATLMKQFGWCLGSFCSFPNELTKCNLVFKSQLTHEGYFYLPSGFCPAKPCLNGGTCYEVKDGFQCDCPVQFYGQTCESGELCLQFVSENNAPLEQCLSCPFSCYPDTACLHQLVSSTPVQKYGPHHLTGLEMNHSTTKALMEFTTVWTWQVLK